MPAFISIDETVFRSTQQAMLKQLGDMGQKMAQAVTQAMVIFANDLLREMKALITHRAGGAGGRLASSGHVPAPRAEGDEVIVEIVWDAPYAWLQDQGGIITPKDFRASVTPSGGLRGKGGRFITRARTGAARLFIPLRPGVTAANAKGAGYVRGQDFEFVKAVKIPPMGFISKVLYGRVTVFSGGTQIEGASAGAAGGGRLGNADRDVGKLAEKILEQIVNG